MRGISKTLEKENKGNKKQARKEKKVIDVGEIKQIVINKELNVNCVTE